MNFLKKNSLKKKSSKLCFPLCMEFKFALKNIFFFFKFHNFLDILQMRLMIFATVLWKRQFTYNLIYRFEIYEACDILHNEVFP